MPELPEVQTVASELNRKLKGKTIKRVEVNAPKMVSVGPNVVSNIRPVKNHQVAKFIKLLQGQSIASVGRRAKLLIFDLSGPLSILVHLKMTGQFIFEDRKLRRKTKGLYRLMNTQSAALVALPSKHTHVVFTFKDGAHLYFNDIRKFGYLKVVTDEEINQVRELQEYGPEPLSKDFSWYNFLTAVKKLYQKRKIKEVLMDPKVVAGIGNIYSDEILFLSGLRPDRKVASIKYQVLRKVHNNIKKVLRLAIKAKGSSVGDFIRTDGSWGQMGKHHFVYGRGGEKCKVCGSTIKTLKIGGRTASYCPYCQK